ncbi:hypothetical protein LZD49_25695 [Dyadobacter sp. CY261]|uniref:hypothetical protein n=1 Tax=Dyadobacter sp. CY261 TaxID=2907203 RepID=UPI001F492451|nr:hypothetical protein [Dyadobacter sp. CY261]MCF0073900.1 hypothetical protein [Dyadobacter sp. CY261]
MKQIRPIILIVIALAGSCKKSDNPIVPVEVWSDGCLSLAREGGGYRLGGMCCAYLQIPIKEFRAGTTRIVGSTYSSFTGAGYADQSVSATVKVSESGDKVSITYTAGIQPTIHELTPGPAKLSCPCYCD